jgi:hypothetical protein
MTTYHIFHNGTPFTYMVFGPFANGTEWDVEVHSGHVSDNANPNTYLFTESDLSRDTHIVSDMWDAMDAFLAESMV